jgi:hypothetical protein
VTYNGLGQPTSGSGTTETSPPPAQQSTGKASLLTVNGFQYTVATGPIWKSIYNNGGAPAPPGYLFWEITVELHNVQTDREAPAIPTDYMMIDSVDPATGRNCSSSLVSCYSVYMGAVTAPSGYFAPSQTIQMQYESQREVPQTLNPSSMRWIFVTDSGSFARSPTGVPLDIPPS